jgi:hypothetical protein
MTVAAFRPDRLSWRARTAAWPVTMIMLVSCLTMLVPFLFVSIPPLVDYPNHLARFWLLGGGVRDPVMAQFYGVDWSKASTNIGVDLAVASLTSIAPARVLGFVAALFAAVGPPVGLICLNRVVFRRFDPWQALFPISAWSTTFLMGFLNFQIGLGLALLSAAADPWLRRRFGGFVGPARVLIAAVLAVDHLFALLFYAALVAALAFGARPVAFADWRAWLARVRDAALAAVWCVIPLALLAVFAPALPGSDPQSVGILFGLSAYKVFALATALSAYNAVVGLGITVSLIGGVVWLARRKAIGFHLGLLLVGGVMVVLSVVSPDHVAGGSWISRRFPTMALLALLAAVQLKPDVALRWGPRFSAPVLALVAAQAAWVTWNWRAMDADMSAVRSAVAAVPAGARLLPLQHVPDLAVKWRAPAGRYMSSLGDPTFRHYGALATPLRRAFVPNLFSAKGLQPLRVVGDWDSRVEHNGGELASVSALGRPWRTGDPTYLRDWRPRFDFLLVVNADLPDAAGAFRPPPGVVLVDDTGFAQLWKVEGR